MNNASKSDILAAEMIDHLFPRERQLVPNVDDVYELEIAFLEHQMLSDAELIRNGAYFSRIADKKRPALLPRFKKMMNSTPNLPFKEKPPMKLETFETGIWRQRYQYKSFEPVKINREWHWEDTTINTLLEKANRALGELNAFSLIVPDIDLFI